MTQRESSILSPGATVRLRGVFDRYSPQLYRYLLRRLRRPADAADLTQEIFERFLRGEGSGKVQNPQAYLFGIAANAVVDARLAQGRNPVTYDSRTSDALSETLCDPSPDPAERLGLEQELRTALDQLPDVHRAAFLLTKWEGLSVKQAAARLQLTEGSVMVYVCEARARLKTLLRRHQEEGAAP